MTANEMLGRLQTMVSDNPPKPLVAVDLDSYFLGWEMAMEEVSRIIYDADPGNWQVGKRP